MNKALRHLLLILAVSSLPKQGFAEAAPRRVVSMNVCTDQLAILLARPGQLYSVSFLASDPRSSLLHEEAKGFLANRGQAEDIFLMKPDLVLAGTYTTRTTVSLLRRLGFRVEEFAPENSLDEIKANIARMGQLLGTEQKAAELINEINAQLAALGPMQGHGPSAVFYYSNSYTSGQGTIIDDLAQKAGLQNIASDLGLKGTAYLPLEALLLAKPQVIVANETSEVAPALAQQNFQHPAFLAIKQRAKSASIDGRWTACGSPLTARAAAALNKAAVQVIEGAQQ